MKIVQLTTDVREHTGDYSCRQPGFGAAPAALLHGMASLPDLEVHVVSCARARMESPKKLADNIWFHSLHVPKLGWMKSLYWGTRRAVRQKVAELRPDLVHGQGTELDCALSAAFCGFPNVVTLHGHMRRIAEIMRARPFSFHWLAARLEVVALRRTNAVICLNSYTQRRVLGLTARTWIVPNAIPTSYFDIPRQLTPRPTLLCVANIHPWKNVNFLLRALTPLAAESPLQLLVCGGDGGHSAYYQEFQQLLAERPWCSHRGFAQRAEIMEALGKASMLIQPSLEDNCPLAILEAMAAGVPVAASTAGGIPDLIKHGRTGLLFDPHDEESLRRAVHQLLEHGQDAEAMAGRARQWAAAHFRPEIVARRHIEIYRELLTGSGSAASSTRA